MREWGDNIEYVGYIETKLSLPMGKHTFEIEALLLVLPTTEYQKRVPVVIGTTITDMVVDFINHNEPENVSNLGKWCAVPPSLEDWCCVTQIPYMGDYSVFNVSTVMVAYTKEQCSTPTYFPYFLMSLL